jgi:hypothetical protein
MLQILISLAAAASYAPAASPATAAETAPIAIVTEAPQAPASPFAAPRMRDGDLGLSTAREDIGQIATAEQTAVVSDSKVSGNVQTGAVSISDNAFQNLSGLSVINANSGNNVAINAAMNVNVTILRD